MTEQAQLLDDQPSSLFVALQVRKADAVQCAETLSKLNERLKTADGFRDLDVIRRDDGRIVDFYIVARFRNEEALDRWRSDPERRALLDDVQSLALNEIGRQEATGSTVWFEPIVSKPGAPTPPPLWKRWTLSMVAVYPPLVFLVTLLEPLTEHLPQPVSLFIVAVVLTGLTTAYLIPWLTRRLQRWLAAS